MYLYHHPTVVPRIQKDAMSSVVLTHATVRTIVVGKNVHCRNPLKTAWTAPMLYGNGIPDGGLLNWPVNLYDNIRILHIRFLHRKFQKVNDIKYYI